MAYPSDITSFSNPQGTTNLATDDHALQHRTAGSAIVALENKVGVGSGSAAANQILVGSGAGTAQWGTVWNTAQLGTPTIGTPAITGGTATNLVSNTPTLGTPTLTLGSDAQGDVFYRSAAGTLTRLAPGTSGQFLKTQGAAANPVWANVGSDGWTDDSSHTWVYASASTFTIAGVDLTTTFTKGTRLRFKQGGSYKYYVVVGSSFSTDTTVTIAVNNDYTIANAVITDNYYSYSANPQGYPGWFSYTPTFGGFSASPVVECKYSINGRLFHMQIVRTSGGTSNATSFTISIPFTAALATNVALIANATDNTAALTTPASGDISNGGTSITVYSDFAGSGWTNSGTKFVNATIITEF